MEEPGCRNKEERSRDKESKRKVRISLSRVSIYDEGCPEVLTSQRQNMTTTEIFPFPYMFIFFLISIFYFLIFLLVFFPYGQEENSVLEETFSSTNCWSRVFKVTTRPSTNAIIES